MKKFYGFIALVCCALVAQAQPTLVASTSNPVVNDAFTVYSFTPTANQQGSAGANQTWNFASLSSSTTLTSTMISPTGTPYVTAHPTATIVNKTANTNYEYYKTSSTIWERQGFYNLSAAYSYENAQTLLSYPLSYTGTFNDTYRGSFSIGGTIFGFRNGSSTVVADAWGTLTTPAASYTNTLRVKYTDSYLDSTFLSGAWQVKNYSMTTYLWFKSGIHYPLMGISYVTGASTSSNAYWIRATGVGIEENLAAQLNMLVYPNPAQERSTLSLELTEASDVMVRVLDLQGREVIAVPMERYLPGKLQLPLDVANLASGNYLLQAIINDRNATIRFDKQ